MKPQRLEAVVWVLIYGGMVLAALALFVGEALATPLALAGALGVGLGMVGIWWRSRLDD